jgi:hypothetical protein
VNSLEEAANWLWGAAGAKYVWWLEGEVSRYDGAPAWAVNAPVPHINDIRQEGGFCVAVKSLIERYHEVPIPNPFNDEAYDGGTLSTYRAHFDDSYYYGTRQAQGWRTGDVLCSPWDGSSQGHVGVVIIWNGEPLVLEWIVNGGLTWNYSPEESNRWGAYQIAIPVEAWLGDAVHEVGGSPKPPSIPTSYPGDCAPPKQVAYWMAHVAETEFALPAVLPVMCSAVEITAAWTAPGCVTNLPGYYTNVDYDSLGYFQQRPSQGWGTYAQVTNAEYALRKFCEVAASKKDWEWNQNTTDPDSLGRWCQAVQISGVPDAYRDKGYGIAADLLKDYKSGVVVDPVTGGGEEDMELAKYTFVAKNQPATDFANCAVSTLEAYGISALALNSDANIQSAVRSALRSAESDGFKPNIIVVGEDANKVVGQEDSAYKGWNQDDIIWYVPQSDDAATLGFVNEYAVGWIAKNDGTEPTTGLALTFVDMLSMYPEGHRYMEMLTKNPLDPPPTPVTDLEEKMIKFSEARSDDLVMVRRKKEK